MSLIALSIWLQVWTDVGRTVPDTPTNHWIYEGLSQSKREGFLIGYPDGLSRGGRPYETLWSIWAKVRYSIGSYHDVASKVVRNGESIAAAPHGSSTSEERLQAYREDRELLIKDRSLLSYFRRVQSDFLPHRSPFFRANPETTAGLAELERLSNRLSALGPLVVGERFRIHPNVPASCWAAKAVGDSSALEMLQSYTHNRSEGKLGGTMLAVLPPLSTTFPNVPKNKWVYDGLAISKRIGLLRESDLSGGTKRLLTVGEVIVGIKKAVEGLERTNVLLIDERDLLLAKSNGRDWQIERSNFFVTCRIFERYDLQKFFHLALTRFDPELRLLGESASNLRVRYDYAFGSLRALSRSRLEPRTSD